MCLHYYMYSIRHKKTLVSHVYIWHYESAPLGSWNNVSSWKAVVEYCVTLCATVYTPICLSFVNPLLSSSHYSLSTYARCVYLVSVTPNALILLPKSDLLEFRCKAYASGQVAHDTLYCLLWCIVFQSINNLRPI